MAFGVHAEHEHYKWWALSCTSLGMLLATINSGTLIIALPDLERALGTSILDARLGDPRLHDRLDRARAHGGAPLGPLRPQAGLRRRLPRLRAGLARRRLRGRRHGADPLARSSRASAAPSSSPTPPRSSPTRSRKRAARRWPWARTRWSPPSASCSGRCSAARSWRSRGTGSSGSTCRSALAGALWGALVLRELAQARQRSAGSTCSATIDVRRRAHRARARDLARAGSQRLGRPGRHRRPRRRARSCSRSSC